MQESSGCWGTLSSGDKNPCGEKLV